MRTILMPFPGAHWFVAILGPVPGAKPEDVLAEPTAAEASVPVGPPDGDPGDPAAPAG